MIAAATLAAMAAARTEMAVGEDGIRLGQLLKLAGIAESGGSVKTLLSEGWSRSTVDPRPVAEPS